MIKHGKDAGNTVNQLRYKRLRQTSSRQIFEGLSGLDTILKENILYKTHTRLKVVTYKTGLQRDLELEAAKKAKEKAEKEKAKASKEKAAADSQEKKGR